MTVVSPSAERSSCLEVDPQAVTGARFCYDSSPFVFVFDGVHSADENQANGSPSEWGAILQDGWSYFYRFKLDRRLLDLGIRPQLLYQDFIRDGAPAPAVDKGI